MTNNLLINRILNQMEDLKKKFCSEKMMIIALPDGKIEKGIFKNGKLPK